MRKKFYNFIVLSIMIFVFINKCVYAGLVVIHKNEDGNAENQTQNDFSFAGEGDWGVTAAGGTRYEVEIAGIKVQLDVPLGQTIAGVGGYDGTGLYTSYRNISKRCKWKFCG